MREGQMEGQTEVGMEGGAHGGADRYWDIQTNRHMANFFVYQIKGF